ncbi:hypothetical protein FPSE5266_03859 [Fusarium pseudograminearum]|nr:hypothetical protein FPSE5266_03859 [Fusarium pseudograminearum]
MNGVIEALHIYDDNRNPILSHTYAGRPMSATHLLPLYLEHPAPRPNLIYLPNTSPPTLVFNLMHANLLFIATSSTEIEPLLVFEFLHRIIDAFEDFLGAPLLAVKIENNYDIVAQLLTEMCDAGIISTTEPNALREVVEQEGWVGKLLGSINLPGKAPLSANFSNSSTSSILPSNSTALPWRRANVRHTSNEMYADIVETLSVTLAPSGRPLAAFANGTIAFTSKVSGVPDITLNITSPSGKHNLGSIMELPVFHPCVRLNRWKERPGELSFVPPDGRFILAGYEVDLLPFTSGKSGSLSSNNLKLPINMEVKTGLGATGSDFEVRLQVNKILGAPSPAPSGLGRGGSGGRLGGPHPGSPGAPLMDDLTLTIPLPADVRNLSEIRPSKGDASFNPGEKFLEWYIPAKELSGGTSYFGLRCTVVGPLAGEDDEGFDPNGFGFNTDYTFDGPYQSAPVAKAANNQEGKDDDKDTKKIAQNKILMPTSASQQRWRSTHRGGTRTALFFPGQGVQRVGMLTPWLEAFPSTASQLRDEIDEYMGYKLSDVIQNGPSRLLTETPNAQPAIMATSIFILRILEREFGFKVTDHFDVTLGHSLGEFAAVVAGGYISFQDSLNLVRKRAEAMTEATKHAIEKYGGEYGMVAVISHPEHMDKLVEAIREFVGISAEDLADLPPIEQVLIANINSKNQIVLSGNIERIKTLIAHVRQFLGYDPRAVRLKADSPFHSPIMKPAVAVMRQLLEEPSQVKGRENEDIVTFPGLLPIVSNVSARPVCCKNELKDLLARGCLDTVRWWDSIKYLDQEARIRRWVGVGPGKVGRNLVGKEVGMRGKDLVKGGGVWAITDPSEVEEVLRGLEDTAGLMEDDEYSE